MTVLSVNLNKVALLRNQRGDQFPILCGSTSRRHMVRETLQFELEEHLG